MISADAIFAFGVAFLVQLGVVIYGYGRLKQKVDDIAKKVDKIDANQHTTPCSGLQSSDKAMAVYEHRIEHLEGKID